MQILVSDENCQNNLKPNFSGTTMLHGFDWLVNTTICAVIFMIVTHGVSMRGHLNDVGSNIEL